MPGRSRTVEIEDLVGSRVVDAEGRTLGHVVDVLVTGLPRPEVVALALGAGAWLARLEVDSPVLRLLRRSRRVKVVPWRHVRSARGSTIQLKPGWEAESQEVDIDEPVIRQPARSQERRRASR
jgi:sporulation protein YlmC with PRC-barrel domain